MRKAVRLLLVSGLYPSDKDPMFGVFVRRQAEALDSIGARVAAVANSDPRGGLLRGASKYVGLWFAARRVAANCEIDAVLGHFLYPQALIAMDVARKAGVPCVLVAHGTDVESLSRGGRIAKACASATRDADHVVAVSEDLARRIVEEIGVDAGKVSVIPTGVDRSVFRPLSADGSQSDDSRKVLFAGNLAVHKGVDVLIEAFARLRTDGAADRLVIVGDGPERSALEARVEEAGLLEEVGFTGILSEQDLAEAMRDASVFVLPSRREGFGLVLLEAMACGTPCVGTEVGGIPEILGPAAGAMVPADDAEALARAISQTLAVPKETHASERQAVVERFDVVECARRLMDVFGKVLDGRD